MHRYLCAAHCSSSPKAITLISTPWHLKKIDRISQMNAYKSYPKQQVPHLDRKWLQQNGKYFIKIMKHFDYVLSEEKYFQSEIDDNAANGIIAIVNETLWRCVSLSIIFCFCFDEEETTTIAYIELTESPSHFWLLFSFGTRDFLSIVYLIRMKN